jgi:hypothetical protein
VKFYRHNGKFGYLSIFDNNEGKIILPQQVAGDHTL